MRFISDASTSTGIQKKSSAGGIVGARSIE
jgi:hypothetical protein